MSFTGGDIIEVACIHPTLGTFRYSAKANEAGTLNKGGLRNDDDSSGVTGNGQVIRKVNRMRWSFSLPLAADIKNATEYNSLDQLAESDQEGTWLITTISGGIYTAVGKPVGEYPLDTNTAQITLKVDGAGKATKV